MDDKPENAPPLVLSHTDEGAKDVGAPFHTTPGTKRRSSSPQKQSGRAQKANKPSPDGTPPLVPSHTGDSGEDVGAPKDVGAPFHPTIATKRMASHSGLISRESIIYANDMEIKIKAEARGVTRKNVPWDAFRSIYLCDFTNAKAQSELTVNSVQEIGEGYWEERLFWERLRKVVTDKILCDLRLSHSGTTTLPDADRDMEVPSKPDFVLHVGKDEESPTWADVELLFEHSRSPKKVVAEKFSQWLCGAWSVFHHQPFRRHLYGIMFIKPYAYICYADHGCAAYSEPLNFAKNTQHTQFLTDFLSAFIANPEYRGRDPTVKKMDDRLYIQYAGKTWVETPAGLLCYRPCLIGRNIRVAWVTHQGTDSPAEKLVMKSTWEEKLPQEPSPPPEVEVLSILLKAKVRGLPQPYDLDSAIVRDDGNSEVETRSFPKNCEAALSAKTTNLMSKLLSSFVSGRTSKSLAPGAIQDIVGENLSRDEFDRPLEVRRRLTRIIMSYCKPLKDAMRNKGPETLMQTIRDSMIVYYEAYKLPESGFIHGDISLENILVPMEASKLTGGLTYKDRRGTLIDWNLCFTVDGTTSRGTFRSGTPAFMAPVILENKQITRRTLAHDMESFFTVIIWIASLNYEDKAAFQAKPLAEVLLRKNNSPSNIATAKICWFDMRKEFLESILRYFEPAYIKDERFLRCLLKLRNILYPDKNFDEALFMAKLDQMLDGKETEEETEETEDADPMKEDLFRRFMKEIDDYLNDKKGTEEIQWIDSQASASRTHISESLAGGDGSG